MADHEALAAGEFSAWLDGFEGALRGEHGSVVPCDGCTACCRSSQFIHIEPDEADTIAHVPAELLVPAPGLPDGHVVMGYDEHGCCPMLVDDQCSIYEHRPRTCRTYDCRVFPATGIEPDPEVRPLLAARTRRWVFTYADEDARALHDALRADPASVLQMSPDRATSEGQHEEWG